MQHRTYLAALLLALMACSDDPPPSPPDDSKIRLWGVVSRNDEPMAGARVLLNSEPTYRRFDDAQFPAVAITGPRGYFEFERVHKQVRALHDLSVRDDSLGRPLITRFLNLADLEGAGLFLSGERPRPAWSTSVFTSILNLPANARVFYIAFGHVIGVQQDDGLVIRWNGVYQDDVFIRAIVYEEDGTTHLPLRYLGTASNWVRVTHEQPTHWLASFAPIATSETEFQLSPPDNAPPPDSVEGSIFVDAGDGSNAREIGHLSSATGKVTLPNFPGVRYTLRAEQRAAAGRSRLFRYFGPGDTSVQMKFTNPPKLLDAPAHGATIERDATLRWQGDGLTRIVLDAGSAFRLETYTAAKECTLPSAALDLLGVTVAPNTPIQVTVTSYPWHGNINDTAINFRAEDQDAADAPALPLVIH
ncbi:hypothetical protein LZC95_36065 [Pendulispora brunnea]|uniref:Carboxypeptidase regulatory-like domain-containing protein n=1 Tax=Pendulispora brunnea TaxID=2905690 RepID=A0ABZ2K2T8_9BACT